MDTCLLYALFFILVCSTRLSTADNSPSEEETAPDDDYGGDSGLTVEPSTAAATSRKPTASKSTATSTTEAEEEEDASTAETTTDCFTAVVDDYEEFVAVKNSGSCTCEEARDQATNKHKIGQYIPQCDENGDFMEKQLWGSTGFAWCVDESGNQNSGSVRAFARKLQC